METLVSDENQLIPMQVLKSFEGKEHSSQNIQGAETFSLKVKND